MRPLLRQIGIPWKYGIGLFAHLLKRVFQDMSESGYIVLDLLLRIQEFTAEQMLFVQIGHGLTLADLLVHERVGE